MTSNEKPSRLVLNTVQELQDHLIRSLHRLEGAQVSLKVWIENRQDDLFVLSWEATKAARKDAVAPGFFADWVASKDQDILRFVLLDERFLRSLSDILPADNPGLRALADMTPGIPQHCEPSLPEITLSSALSAEIAMLSPDLFQNGGKSARLKPAMLGGLFMTAAQKEKRQQDLAAEEKKKQLRALGQEISRLSAERPYYIDSFMEWYANKFDLTAEKDARQDDSAPMLATAHLSPTYMIAQAQADYDAQCHEQAKTILAQAEEYRQLAQAFANSDFAAMLAALPLFAQSAHLRRLVLEEHRHESLAALFIHMAGAGKIPLEKGLYAARQAFCQEKDLLLRHNALDHNTAACNTLLKQMESAVLNQNNPAGLSQIKAFIEEDIPAGLLLKQAHFNRLFDYRRLFAQFGADSTGLRAVLSLFNIGDKTESIVLDAMENLALSYRTADSALFEASLAQVGKLQKTAYLTLQKQVFPHLSGPTGAAPSGLYQMAREILSDTPDALVASVADLAHKDLLPEIDSTARLARTLQEILALDSAKKASAVSAILGLFPDLPQTALWSNTLRDIILPSFFSGFPRSKDTPDMARTIVRDLMAPIGNNCVKAVILDDDFKRTAYGEQQKKNLRAIFADMLPNRFFPLEDDRGTILLNPENLLNAWIIEENGRYGVYHAMKGGDITPLFNNLTLSDAEAVLSFLQRQNPGIFTREKNGLVNLTAADVIECKEKDQGQISWRKTSIHVYIEEQNIAQAMNHTGFISAREEADGYPVYIRPEAVLSLVPVTDEDNSTENWLFISNTGYLNLLKAPLTGMKTLTSLGGIFFHPDAVDLIQLDETSRSAHISVEGHNLQATFHAISQKFGETPLISEKGDALVLAAASQAEWDDFKKTISQHHPYMVSPGGDYSHVFINLKALQYLTADFSNENDSTQIFFSPRHESVFVNGFSLETGVCRGMLESLAAKGDTSLIVSHVSEDRMRYTVLHKPSICAATLSPDGALCLTMTDGQITIHDTKKRLDRLTRTITGGAPLAPGDCWVGEKAASIVQTHPDKNGLVEAFLGQNVVQIPFAATEKILQAARAENPGGKKQRKTAPRKK